MPRSNDDSFEHGVLSWRQYVDGQARSIVSLQMCYMGWSYELLANVFIVLSPTLHKYGMPNVYMVDAIVMFVVIPFVHLMNDEKTKGIISEENWYQGLRHMIGMNKEAQRISPIPQPNKASSNKSSSSYHAISHTDKNDTIRHKSILIRRCNSSPKLFSSEVSISLKKSESLHKSNSLANLISA